MQAAFSAILQAQRARYPLMQPQDYGKLAYQRQFGPAHMAPDREQVCRALLTEWAAVVPNNTVPPWEDIGSGLCRFHLTDAYDPAAAAPLLTELFLLTAQTCHGTVAGLAEDLASLQALPVPGIAAWLADYRRQGFPPLSHSKVFRDAYRPHYRLLKTPYAGYFPVLLRLSALLRTGKPAVVAIDGRCGSGKTGLADLIALLFPCNILHMDDFYLPMEQRAPDWEQTPGGNIDFARLLTEALTPARGGRAFDYRAYSCQRRSFREAVKLRPQPLTVVEGSYSHHPLLRAGYDLKIFLTCSKEEQARRLKEREGAHYAAYETRWVPMEERYIRQCAVGGGDTAVVDTTALF